jgi:O-antigen ligase
MAGPPHNLYLFTLIQWGLVGLLPYIAVFVLLIRRALKVRRASPDEMTFEYRFANFFLATTVVYMTGGLFADAAALPFLSTLYFIGAGILATLPTEKPDIESPDGSQPGGLVSQGV